MSLLFFVLSLALILDPATAQRAKITRVDQTRQLHIQAQNIPGWPTNGVVITPGDGIIWYLPTFRDDPRGFYKLSDVPKFIPKIHENVGSLNLQFRPTDTEGAPITSRKPRTVTVRQLASYIGTKTAYPWGGTIPYILRRTVHNAENGFEQPTLDTRIVSPQLSESDPIDVPQPPISVPISPQDGTRNVIGRSDPLSSSSSPLISQPDPAPILSQQSSGLPPPPQAVNKPVKKLSYRARKQQPDHPSILSQQSSGPPPPPQAVNKPVKKSSYRARKQPDHPSMPHKLTNPLPHSAQPISPNAVPRQRDSQSSIKSMPCCSVGSIPPQHERCDIACSRADSLLMPQPDSSWNLKYVLLHFIIYVHILHNYHIKGSNM